MFICACLSGCYIAPYDSATDQALSDIQKKVDQRIADVQSPTTRPAGDFYGPLRQEIHSLSIRLNARQQGDLSIDKENQALGEVQAIVDDIQANEADATTRPVIPAAWGNAQQSFDTAIGAVLGLELKRK